MQNLNEIEERMVEVELIDEPLYPSRTESLTDDIEALAEDIKRRGLQQAIGLRILPNGRYRVIWGHRRFGAHCLADLPTIRAKAFECTDEEEHELLTVENDQRVDLNPLERANTYARDRDVFGKSIEQIAFKYHRAPETIQRALRMLEVPERFRGNLIDKSLSMAAAEECLLASNDTEKTILFHTAIEQRLSAREVRRYREDRALRGTDVQMDELYRQSLKETGPTAEPGEKCSWCETHHPYAALTFKRQCPSCDDILIDLYREYYREEQKAKGENG